MCGVTVVVGLLFLLATGVTIRTALTTTVLAIIQCATGAFIWRLDRYGRKLSS